MSATVTGGPAFPVPGLQDDETFNGMTLRDFFAAKAMQVGFAHMLQAGISTMNRGVAMAAYEMADAMLLERQA